MDLNARIDVNFFKVDVNFQTAIVDHIPQKVLFIFIPINIKVLLTRHTKFQPNILSRFGENSYFISFAILVAAAILNSRPD